MTASPAMEMELLVKLKIPDTTAITAFNAVRRMGIREMKKLKREDYFRFRVSRDDFEKVSEELGKTDVLVNANKHSFRTKLASEPLDPGEDGMLSISMVSTDMGSACEGLLKVLRERLGLSYIESAEKGTLWTMCFDQSVPREKAWELARKVGGSLLVSRHYQEARFLEGSGSPRVLVIFGSRSDAPVYEKITRVLSEEGIEHELRICSAHRSPALLEEILYENPNSLVIAGAGLAAHLPGVVASKTIRPVIGVPCDGNYQGLDAMLSIMQMPPGIPVLGVGVWREEQAASMVPLILRDYETVNLVGDRNSKRLQAAADMLKEFGAMYELSDELKKDAINIRFVELDNYIKPDVNCLVINVPLSSKNQAMDALRVMSISKDGLWVGLNRGDNAAIAAVQIMAMSGRHEARLKEYRKEMEMKVREDEVNRRHKPRKATTYKDSGVDIDAGNLSLQMIKEHVRRTFTPDVRMDLGKFGGAISASRLRRFDDPVLIASIDGVGTKVMVARMMGKWDTVGKDIVNHSANDILTTGADPMFFLDYIASERLEPDVIEQILKGMSEACVEAGIALIGGETAEMPGTYCRGEKDIAGCIVGTVDRSRMIDGSGIQEGDMLVGLASNGLHTNGYSLARKVLFDRAGFGVKDRPPELGGESVGEALLKPHTLYSRAVLPLLNQFDIRGIAHITGGGLVDNTPRIFPEGLSAVIEKSSIRVPPVFSLIQEKGDVPEDDMYRAFNMGVGLVLAVPQAQAGQVIQALKSSGINSNVIGRMVKGNFGVRLE